VQDTKLCSGTSQNLKPRSIWYGATHFPTLHTFRKMCITTSLTVGSSCNFNSWS